MRRLALLLPILLPGALVAETAAETAAEAPASTAAAVAAPTQQWGGEHGFALLASDDSGIRIATPLGSVHIGVELAADPAAAPALADLVARARAAGVASADGAPDFTFSRSALTGLRLANDRLLITADGVLTRQDLVAPQRAAQVAQLKVSAASLAQKLPGKLTPLAGRTLGEMLEHLADADDPELDATGIDPAVARQLAAAGFLREYVDNADETEAAVAAAGVPRAVSAWAGEGCRIEELADAYGHRVWTLRTATSVVLAAPAPLPRAYPHGRFAQALVRLQLQAGADPLAPSDAEIAAGSAALWAGGVELATWSHAAGFHSDAAAWRKQFTAKPRDYEHPVENFLPPHLALRDGSGAIRLLVTAYGELRPPSGDPADAERFLREAAETLPDAAHAALVGQYLFAYCYDSPDPRSPRLLGTLEEHGDIHQTAAQTLARAVAGRCLGDCDDLAELFQALCERQGRNAIVISLPRHLACAYAEMREGRWHVDVLHTGHPLEFIDRALPPALVAMYKSFDRDTAVDPNQINLSLRFGSENTRSSWRLSWRIFAEPAYAKTMIEVQRDWYFHTYQRGISTMRALIAAGDDDTANYSELAGLFRKTGRWSEAIDFSEQAASRLGDSLAKLHRAIEHVGLLTRAQRHDEASLLARRIADHDLPSAAVSLGRSVAGTAIRLAGNLDGRADPDLCIELLERWAVPDTLAAIPPMRAWIRDHFDQHLWDEHPDLVRPRELAAESLAAAQRALERLGVAAAEDDQGVADCLRLDQAYLDDIAFRDGEPGALAHAYAYAGWYYELTLGRATLRALLARTALPATPNADHSARVGGLAQLPSDLPWIKASVPYWWSAVARDVWGDDGQGPCDVALARADLDELLRAHEATQASGLSSRYQVEIAAQARLLAALLGQDAGALAAALDAIAADQDRRLTESTAELIGNAARALPAAWFDAVLAAWSERVDSKPFYFLIAWTALVADADDRALAAARLAARRFADDPAFAEELALIEQRVAERAKQSAAKRGE